MSPLLLLPSTLSPFLLSNLLLLLTTKAGLPLPPTCMLALDAPAEKEVVTLQLFTPRKVIKFF